MSGREFDIYCGRMGDRELERRLDSIRSEGVPVEARYTGDGFGYILVPSSKAGKIDQYLEEMSEEEKSVDEAHVSSHMNLGEGGLARLNGEEEPWKALESRGDPKPAD